MTTWDVAPLGDLCSRVKSWNPITTSPQKPFEYIDLGAINAAQKNIETVQTLIGADAPSRARQLVAEGDILVSTVRPNLNSVATVPSQYDGATASTGFTVLRCDPARLDNRFAFNWVRSPVFIADMVRKSTGASYPAVSDRIVKQSPIPLPPLPEQRRIAAILDHADALRTKRRETLATLDELTQSIFDDMFGDPTSNPMRWPKYTLQSVAREGFSNGVFRKNGEYTTEIEGSLPVIWVSELFRGNTIDTSTALRLVPEKSEIARHGLRYGDILFCRSSLKLDGIAYCNTYLGEDLEALYECHLIRLRPDLRRVNPMYMNTALRDPRIREVLKAAAKTSTMTTIDQKSLGSIQLAIPPVETQNIFASHVERIEFQKKSGGRAAAEGDALFTSLQSRAFRDDL
ncbi:restriction endonuclease subunit S [Antrihabitans sp. NCIMB 15449]|uniref:Restriction endonuclease subunit S n=1 Tax=Antrihabitans spumae TaxID=3373370 RepID=A0ABW7JR10_9NOCA